MPRQRGRSRLQPHRAWATQRAHSWLASTWSCSALWCSVASLPWPLGCRGHVKAIPRPSAKNRLGRLQPRTSCRSPRILVCTGLLVPPDRGACNNIIISIEPLTSERLDRLNLHHPDFERWRGVVTISPCCRQILSSNYDPAHPERFAIWGDLFMFGDPELIARLITKRS
jgi:hypothetical protein